jgi:hypothetical protein
VQLLRPLQSTVGTSGGNAYFIRSLPEVILKKRQMSSNFSFQLLFEMDIAEMAEKL